ncbi:LysM peptidoglycan-binding domain-containing protein [Streptomyces sp. NBC_00820]|uniref:transglycosylase family protein n=1 Tax=Streptomyces sp. NBC_00820 TaxID=2975842 RepID=UPI002ED25D00|nr:LysM peptidoglycan-binding domain-containing protein [Streptomyces sp. NBC_00820]
MLSGNGRHRRPRQAPALLVAAGVTGSAIAIPLLGAASAHAADGTTWDKVAECESGGSWSADPGNGFYGGLQISQADWSAYGGTQYAETADQASRSQQISVAEKILADKGTTPWATCALLSGLTSNSGSVNVDTGVGGSATPGTADSGDNSGSAGKSGSDKASESPALPDSSPSPDSSSKGADKKDDQPASASGDSSDTGKGADTSGSEESAMPNYAGGRVSDGPVTRAPAVKETDNSAQTGGSWALVDTGSLDSGGRHRGGSAAEDAKGGQKADSSGRHALRDAGTYTVHEGDTLGSIADSLDLDGGWRALYSLNKKDIGTDANNIAPGQTLKVGDEKGA